MAHRRLIKHSQLTRTPQLESTMRYKKLSKSELIVWAIDDDEISLDITSDMLSQLGVKHVHVETLARQAIERLVAREPKPDLIIVDLYMPDMDGIELVSELTRLRFAGGVIMVSGVNAEMLELAQLLATEGGINVLAAWEKPLRIEALAVALNKYVQTADQAAV